jgi:hypothetical protein
MMGWKLSNTVSPTKRTRIDHSRWKPANESSFSHEPGAADADFVKTDCYGPESDVFSSFQIWLFGGVVRCGKGIFAH